MGSPFLHVVGVIEDQSFSGNKCSVLHLKDCSEVTKLDSEVSLSRENFYFLRSRLSSHGLIVVQPRPEAKAGQSDQGWTVQIEENGSSLKVNELSLRDSPLQMQLLSSSMDLFFMLFKRLNA